MIADVKNFEILTDDIENSFRLNLCNSCEMKRTDTICDACACPIE